MPLNLNRFLFKDGTELNFFQAVYLLEKLFPERGRLGTGDDMRSEPLRFETLNSLSFPPGEVAAVLPPLSFRDQALELDSAKRGDEPPADPDSLLPVRELLNSGIGPLRMSLTFMGLYGVSSPLPSYFTDPITLKKIEYFELKKFLDIFTHRLYSLFYRSWKKYRHHSQFDPARPDEFTLRLLALTGQWPRRNAKPTEGRPSAPVSPEFNLRRIPYARFLGNRVRSAKGLQQLLRGYFGFEKVRVRQFEAAWVEIPVKTRLGEARVTLGKSTRLGDRMQDRLSRFTVEIGPLPRKTFNRFLPPEKDLSGGFKEHVPGSAAGEKVQDDLLESVKELIDAYLRDPLDYQVKVILEPGPEETPVLGSAYARMGMGVWLGNRPLEEIACRL
ncbi:MAG: type VI secretion system baseplate subunit TssG [Fibrobacteria bacterium]